MAARQPEVSAMAAEGRAAPKKDPSNEEPEKLFYCTGEENKHLVSCVVSFFLLVLIVIFLAIICVVMGVVLNKFDKVVFLLDRFHLDIAMTVVSVFIIVVFISIMFETCMWCCCPATLCGMQCVIANRLLVIAACIGLFAGFIICMNNFVDKDNVRTGLVTSLRTFYHGVYETDPFSSGWNYIQVEYESCGVDGPRDYRAMNTSWAVHNRHFTVPLTCCQGVERYYQVEIDKYKTAPDKVYNDLTISYTAEYVQMCNNISLQAKKTSSPIKQTGSLDQVHKDLVKNLAHNSALVALLVLVMVVQVLIFFITLAVCCNFKKEQREKEERRKLLYG